YIHCISHNLRRIAAKSGVDVVFSAPERLQKLCKQVNTENNKRPSCSTQHCQQFVTCTHNVVYAIPLSCGNTYIGQTGRCINERLREHQYNVNKVISGHLGIHCRDCSCKPMFESPSVLYKAHSRMTREIVEAYEIAKLQQKCVSKPSVSLSE
ncbi:uncharacterized protein, partial [Dermacentor albipictus]|uniref:uncharacterized protein n=1 Tax=Dermacentor albipictus TaxID=60249 RepID=UPI0038FC3D9B